MNTNYLCKPDGGLNIRLDETGKIILYIEVHVNADKCKVMHMGFNNKPAKYDMKGIQLECVSEEKRLGCHY